MTWLLASGRHTAWQLAEAQAERASKATRIVSGNSAYCSEEEQSFFWLEQAVKTEDRGIPSDRQAAAVAAGAAPFARGSQ